MKKFITTLSVVAGMGFLAFGANNAHAAKADCSLTAELQPVVVMPFNKGSYGPSVTGGGEHIPVIYTVVTSNTSWGPTGGIYYYPISMEYFRDAAGGVIRDLLIETCTASFPRCQRVHVTVNSDYEGYKYINKVVGCSHFRNYPPQN